jgi:AcrR family transcriptional regulator
VVADSILLGVKQNSIGLWLSSRVRRARSGLWGTNRHPGSKAIAPPLGLTLAMSAPVSICQASDTEANASLISATSISSILTPRSSPTVGGWRGWAVDAALLAGASTCRYLHTVLILRSVSKAGVRSDWRESRRQSARVAIVEAAWTAVRAEGVAGLSLRDLARRAGITTPTVYAYFDSKNAIYDAMFGHAAEEFASCMSAPYETDNPREILAVGVCRFVAFCTSDLARYQLLFQRTIPGFEPSAESYAPAVRALNLAVDRLARNGITDPRHLDMWTALTTGLVDQQISNDPDGERWVRLIDDFVDMFLAYCQPLKRPTTRVKEAPNPRKGSAR